MLLCCNGSVEDQIVEFLPYARTIARVYAERHCVYHLVDELEGWAVCGLHFALQTYDVDKGPLRPHVATTVQRAIIDGLRLWYGRRWDPDSHTPKPEAAREYAGSENGGWYESHEDLVSGNAWVVWALGYLREVFDDRTYESLVAPFFGQRKDSVAKKWGVDPGRISQIRKAAVNRLRDDVVWNAGSCCD